MKQRPCCQILNLALQTKRYIGQSRVMFKPMREGHFIPWENFNMVSCMYVIFLASETFFCSIYTQSVGSVTTSLTSEILTMAAPTSRLPEEDVYHGQDQRNHSTKTPIRRTTSLRVITAGRTSIIRINQENPCAW